MSLQPINKHTVLKQVRTNGTWEGYIAASKVSPFHITGGWHIGMSVLLCSDRQGNPYYVSHNACEVAELETALNNFKYYNCDSELGKRVRFWSQA